MALLILSVCFLLGRASSANVEEFSIPICDHSVRIAQSINIPSESVYRAAGETVSPLKINLNFSASEFTCNNSSGNAKVASTTLQIRSDQKNLPKRDLHFTKGGYFGFTVPSNPKLTDWYHYSEVCVLNFSESSSLLTMLACYDKRIDKDTGNISYETPNRISKCCPPGYVQDRRTHKVFTCNSSPLSGMGWTPKFYDPNSFTTGRCVREGKEKVFHRYFTTAVDFDGKGKKLITHPSQSAASQNALIDLKKRWYLLEDGRLAEFMSSKHHLNLQSRWKIHDDGFCVDGIINFHSDKKFEGTMSRIAKFMPDNQLALYKISGNVHIFTRNGTFPKPGVQSYAYVGAYFGSLVPLILTVVAYCVTWQTRNIHGWTILSHILALIGSNVFAGTAIILNWDYHLDGVHCAIVGILAHFFYLLAYMWLTMINFDLWWTFRVITTISSGSKKGRIRYLMYACVATLIPSSIVAIGIIMDLNNVHGHFNSSLSFDDSGEGSDCEIIAPKYGTVNCHVSHEGQGIYIYYPLAVLLVINIGFYLRTFINIFRIQWSSTPTLNESSSSTKSALIFLKLFVVSGIGLCFDFIGWISEPTALSPDDISLPFFLIAISNILVRACALFLIFACREEAREKLTSFFSKIDTSTKITRTPGNSIGGNNEALELNSRE